MQVKSKQTGRVLNVPDAFYQNNQQLYEPIQTAQPQVQPVSQPMNIGETIGKGATSVIGDILSPFIKTAKNVGGSMVELGRANTIGAGKDMSDDLIRKMSDINAQLKAETDPVKKQQLLEQSRALSSGLSGITQNVTGATNAANPFLNKEEIKTVTDNPLLEGAKNTAGIMSWAVPFGKGGNVLARALLPGMAAAGLQDFSKRGKVDEELLGNSLIGGAGASALYGLSKIPGLVRGAGKVTEDAGTKLIQSQYNLPRSTANATKLNQTVGDLAEYGITNMDDVQKAAGIVTGKDGVITKLTREAVAKAKPVSTDGLAAIAENIAGDPAIPPGQDKKFIDFIKKGIQRLTDSGTMADNFSGNPSEVYSLIQELEKKAAGITRGRLPNMVSASDQALAQGYRSFADELSTRLFDQAGASGQVVNITKGSPLVAELEKISPKLAERVTAAKTVEELRSIAAPFVRGSIAAGVTETGNNLATTTMGGAVRGVAKAIPSVTDPLAPLRAILDTNSVNAGAGAALNAAGKSMQKVGDVAANPLLKQILYQGVSRMGPVAGGVNEANNTQKDTNTNAGTIPNNNQVNNAQGDLTHNLNLPQNKTDNKELQRKAIQIAMIKDLASGGKHINEIAAVAKMFNLDQDAAQSDIGKLSAKDAALVRSGSSSLQQAKQMISKDPSLLAKSLIPGRPISRSYDAASYNATDSILRLRTGAVARPDEIRAYQQQLFPWIGDDEQTVNFKLKQLEDIFSNYNIQ